MGIPLSPSGVWHEPNFFLVSGRRETENALHCVQKRTFTKLRFCRKAILENDFVVPRFVLLLSRRDYINARYIDAI